MIANLKINYTAKVRLPDYAAIIGTQEIVAVIRQRITRLFIRALEKLPTEVKIVKSNYYHIQLQETPNEHDDSTDNNQLSSPDDNNWGLDSL